ncbi:MULTISPECIES: hypothetical protein [Carboxylicivirga]|uniref:hypothetical protein n=1 Tax=Carboxylicivirga TaxID=1628153 RepID=UPI00163D5DB3|nr:hypothetical protein [Carboxylicivirga sp. M1479]
MIPKPYNAAVSNSKFKHSYGSIDVAGATAVFIVMSSIQRTHDKIVVAAAPLL